MANDYSTRRPFTGSAPRKGEVLVPTFISKCMLHSGIDLDALETWHIAGCSILVGFVVTSEGRKPAMMKIFNEDVRNYIACGCPDDFCPGDRPRDNGHTDDLSIEKMIEDAMSEDTVSTEPAAKDDPASTAILTTMLDQLMTEITEKNPVYGTALSMLRDEEDKKDIIASVGLSKSQAYKTIKDVQALAKAFFSED